MDQGKNASIEPTQIQAAVSIGKDPGPQTFGTAMTACESGKSGRAVNWLFVFAGIDCVAAHYINMGIINQTRFDQYGHDFGAIGDCGGSIVAPYDYTIKWFLDSSIPLESQNPPIYHLSVGGSETVANRAVQPQAKKCINTSIGNPITMTGTQTASPVDTTNFVDGMTVDVDPGSANEETVTVISHTVNSFVADFMKTHTTTPIAVQTLNAGYAVNMSSTYAQQWFDAYAQGRHDGPLASYPWFASCVDPCFDDYPMIVMDRQFPSLTCMQGVPTSGAFLESDPTLTGGPYHDLPGLDSNRQQFYAQLNHRPGNNFSGATFLVQPNTGDCESNAEPSYPSPWLDAIANVVGINAENILVDPNSCGGWTGINQTTGAATGPEPNRYNARVNYAINSAYSLYSFRISYVTEQVCPQPSPSVSVTIPPGLTGNAACDGTTQTNVGSAAMYDLSLRTWLLGVNMLMWDPVHLYVRPDLWGVNSANAPCGMDAWPEYEWFVVSGPDVIPGAYNAGSSPNGGCNGSTGNYQPASPGPSESGGILSLMIADSCGPTHAGGTPFFARAGILTRQFRNCYYRGTAIGPCGVIVNLLRGGSLGGLDTTWTNLCGTGAGSPGTPADPFARDGGCYATYQHILKMGNTGSTAFDIFEGGSLDFTQTSETIIYSNAPDQSATNQCTQYISGGSVKVCEDSALIVVE